MLSRLWKADFVVETSKERLRVPLNMFTACEVQNEAAILLKECKSDPIADRAAINDAYRR